MRHVFNKMPEICQIHSNNTSEKDMFIKKYKHVFEGIGKFPDKVNIKLSKNAILKSNPPRRVALKIYNKLKDNLDRCETMIN